MFRGWMARIQDGQDRGDRGRGIRDGERERAEQGNERRDGERARLDVWVVQMEISCLMAGLDDHGKLPSREAWSVLTSQPLGLKVAGRSAEGSDEGRGGNEERKVKADVVIGLQTAFHSCVCVTCVCPCSAESSTLNS